MKFAFPVSLSGDGNRTVVTAYRPDHGDPIYIADQSHPHFTEILDGLAKGDDNVWELFDIAGAVMRKFNQITERVSWNGSEVLFDGDPIHSVLTEQLSRAIADGNTANYTALAKFWEKLESNPNEHSRTQAYDFLATHAFQITEDGDVVGYKGVAEGLEVGADGRPLYYSTASSRVKGKPSAYVNGVPQPELSRVTQQIGDVVSMPRGEVTHDPGKSCERGLHVATRDYASAYGLVLRVTFNPRDIVSVPTVDRGEKVRVCRYVAESVADDNNSSSPVLRKDEEPVWAGDVGYRA